MTIERIIQEALNQNPLGLKEAFEDEIRARLMVALEDKRVGRDEYLDEDTVVEVMEALVEAAEEEGIELDEEELVELSKKTLNSYMKKAAKK